MNRRVCVLVATAVIAFDLANAVAETTPTPGPSGIEGVIVVSPSHPGPIREDRPSWAPARNVQFVVKRAEVRVASFKTDAEGRFTISLPPGHYSVVREGASARIGRWQFEVDVPAGAVVKVNWVGDSGMR